MLQEAHLSIQLPSTSSMPIPGQFSGPKMSFSNCRPSTFPCRHEPEISRSWRSYLVRHALHRYPSLTLQIGSSRRNSLFPSSSLWVHLVHLRRRRRNARVSGNVVPPTCNSHAHDLHKSESVKPIAREFASIPVSTSTSYSACTATRSDHFHIMDHWPCCL
jgi:hypothetical protein